MKFYKILSKNVVVDTMELDVDGLIEILPVLKNNNEEIEEIEEDEYKALNTLLDEEDTPFTPETIYQDLNLKLTLINFFKDLGTFPTVDELDRYFKWLKSSTEK